LLGYSKQAYHKREKKALIKEAAQKEVQIEVISKVLELRSEMPRIGTRKLYHILEGEFKEGGIKVGRDKLFSVLRDSDLLVKRRKKYTKTTDSSQWRRENEYLIEDYVPEKPEQVLVADITYFATEEGDVYGHIISDAYSKKIMGYCVAADMTKERTKAAFDMAMQNRTYTHWGFHHSDRGSQYCSPVYTAHTYENKYVTSMTQDGSPYENAVAERINGILKEEFGLGKKMKNLEDVKMRMERAVDIYNNKRPHWSCHLLTPNQMHQQQILPVVLWGTKDKNTLITP
jgi:putative transposase